MSSEINLSSYVQSGCVSVLVCIIKIVKFVYASMSFISFVVARVDMNIAVLHKDTVSNWFLYIHNTLTFTTYWFIYNQLH